MMASVYSSPMIIYEPVGRNLMSVHPNDDGTDDDNVFSSVLSQTPKLSNRTSSFSGNSIKKDELWVIREVPQGQEELYAREKCVYWTRNSIIIKSFNFTEPVVKVFWAQFNNKDHVCVALVSGLSIFDRQGQHFQIPLQFAYQEIYANSSGLIIERSCYQLDDPLPELFSLTDPTQEITPMLFKSAAACANLNNSMTGPSKPMDNMNFKQMAHGMPEYVSIVACHDKLPICLLYNSQDCQHSLWFVTKVSDEELDEYQKFMGDQTTLQTTLNHHSVASCSMRDRDLSHHNSPASMNLSSMQRSSLLIQSNPSSMNNGTNFSPKVDVRGRQTMGGLGNLAQSRLGMGATQLASDSNTPNVKSSTIGTTQTLDFMSNPNRTRIINYLRDNIEEPVLPELKLEQIWVEVSTNSLKASKFFTCVDLVGNEYLVMVTPTSGQLKVIRCDTSKIDSTMMLGRPSFISAIDAIPLPKLKMMLIIDTNRNMALYSGVDRITQIAFPTLNLPNNLRSLTSSSPANLRNQYQQQLQNSAMDTTPVHGSSSARKRSSLCDRSYLGQDISMQHIFQTVSPVPHKQDDNRKFTIPIAPNDIKRLDYVVGNNIFILNQEQKRGQFAVPELCQTWAIKRLLDAIKILTNKDLALNVISLWYQARRAHSQPQLMTAKNELRLFKEWLITSIGVTGVYFDDEPASSASGANNSNQMNTPDFSVRFQHQSPTKKTRRCRDIADNNPLIVNIYSIFYAIHLVFEDLLLLKLNYELASNLAELLIILSCVLKLYDYQNYYWLKYPLLCQKYGSKRKQLEGTIAKLDLLQKPAYFQSNNNKQLSPPPSVMDFINKLVVKSRAKVELTSCVKQETLCPYPNIRGVTENAHTMISLFCQMFNVNQDQAIVNINNQTSDFPWDVNLLSQEAKLGRSLENDYKVVKLMVKLGKTRNFLAGLPHGLNLFLWDSILNCRDAPPTEWSEECYQLIGRMDLVCLVSDSAASYNDIQATSKSRNQIRNQMARQQSQKSDTTTTSTTAPPPAPNEPQLPLEQEQEQYMKLIFPDDIRVVEAERMLASDIVLEFGLNSRQGATDDEIRNETQRMIYLLNIRTMGMPVGRGAMGLHTYSPVIGESFEVPRLELAAKSSTEERAVDYPHDTSVFPWPFFHNGVAAGLRICASTSNNIIDSTWINYNRPRSNVPHSDLRDRDMTLANMNNEHAGFLFALGLSGHLEKLSLMALHDYLCQNNDLTKLAILLGMSAAKRGSRDNNIIKVLSIHVDALLPPNSTELDVPPPVHSAAMMGVGLLYQSSGDGHISKVLLDEIGRTPGPESNSHVDRESYSLSAGLAFGLVNLCKGRSTTISSSDQLRDYMLGGPRQPFTMSQRERYLKQDCHRGEEHNINTHITAPSGTLGLGLMYHRSGNASVANWMRAPNTQKLLEYVRPDHLMLRMVAYGLIMWDDITPTEDYIASHVPAMIYQHAFQRSTLSLSGRILQRMDETSSSSSSSGSMLFNSRLPPRASTSTSLGYNNSPSASSGYNYGYNPLGPFSSSSSNAKIDYELISQSYCSIVSGCCMAIALRFAGTANQQAYKTIYRHLRFLMQLHGKPIMLEQAGKSCIESCLNVLVTSLAVVMAGTGDLGVMRACRYLRSRLSQSCIFYGSHMAIHMALGMLFLGNCRYSLRTSPEAVGALVCALYPVYPSHSSDNRYHLQALRHLYVLAAEPRLLIPRDIETGRPVYVNIMVRLRALATQLASRQQQQQQSFDKPSTSAQAAASASAAERVKVNNDRVNNPREITLRAPCLLPELDLIDSVHVVDERYWKIEINNRRNEIRRCLVHALGQLDVKQKAHSSNNQLVADIEKYILKDMPLGVLRSRKETALKECVKEDRVEQFSALNEMLTKLFAQSDQLMSKQQKQIQSERDRQEKELQQRLYEHPSSSARDPSASIMNPKIKDTNAIISNISKIASSKKNSKLFRSLYMEQLNLASKLAREDDVGNKMNLIRPVMDELSKSLWKEKEDLLILWSMYVQGQSDWTSTSSLVAEYIVLNDLKIDLSSSSSAIENGDDQAANGAGSGANDLMLPIEQDLLQSLASLGVAAT